MWILAVIEHVSQVPGLRRVGWRWRMIIPFIGDQKIDPLSLILLSDRWLRTDGNLGPGLKSKTPSYLVFFKTGFIWLECSNGPESMQNRLEIRFYTLAMLQDVFQLHLSSENHHFWFWVKVWWESISISWYRLYVSYTVYIVIPIANRRKLKNRHFWIVKMRYER